MFCYMDNTRWMDSAYIAALYLRTFLRWTRSPGMTDCARSSQPVQARYRVTQRPSAERLDV